MTSTDHRPGSENLGFAPTRLARIASWYQAHVNAGDLPGAVVAIARNGNLAFREAIGFQDRGRTVPMRPDSIFWIASMTKPVTSAAAMILVDEGKLDLDAPVPRYLPELKDMQLATEVADPATGKTQLALAPQKRPMTVLDLLRHTSGLVYPPQYTDTTIHRLYGKKAVFARDRTLADFVASVATLPLAHQPGEVWEYSWGVDVLARVVEVVSAQPFDQFLQTRIFEPLHMVDTGFFVPEAKLARLVDPPRGGRDPLWDVTKPPRLFSGGGGLVSTAADYLRFCQMLLNGGALDGARILTPRSVQLMTTNSLPPDIRFAQDMIGPAAGASWGLGFAIRTDPERSAVPGSVGSYSWGGVWGTVFWIDPAEKLVAVQLIQVAPDEAGPYRAAFRALAYGALQVPDEPQFVAPAQALTLSAQTLADYVGTYDFGVSTSSRDRQGPWPGVGIQIAMADRGAKIIERFDATPAARAGIVVGDVITEVDGAPVKGLALDQVLDKMQGHIDTPVRLTIQRQGNDNPIDITVVRAAIHSPAVQLKVRRDAGNVLIEATGLWPILEFERGKRLAVTALSNSEFYVDSGDHTRIAFVRDAAGKVSGVILNPGPWEQKGVKSE